MPLAPTTSPHPQPPLPGRRATFLSCGLLLLAVLLSYGHTLHVPWFLDDYPNLVENPELRNLPLTVRNLLAPRGIALFTFALNYRFGGLDPRGYHLLNIGLHLANGILVYLLLCRLFPQPRPWLARFGALLFVLHPLQTQAVTYTVQRMTSLSATFFLFTLYAFLRARALLANGAPCRAPRHLAWYGAALLSGSLAVLTKENAALLPLALLLIVRFFSPEEADGRSRLILYLAPFTLAPLVLGFQLLLLPLLSGESLQAIGNARLADNSPLRYLFTEFQVLWVYLRLLVLPFGQALDHDYPLVARLVNPASLLGLAGLCALGALAVRRRHDWPCFSFAVGWFFLTLAVESSFIPLDPLFEHRLYLPLFGLSVAATAGLRALKTPRNAAILGSTLLIILGILTWQRNQHWTDQIALFEDNLRQVPHSSRVRDHLSGSYLMAGRSAEAGRVLAGEAGDSVESLVNLARVYLEQGRLDEADALLRQARQRNPEPVKIYLAQADLYEAQRNLPAALASLNDGLRYHPQSCYLYNRLGTIYLSFGQPQRALGYLNQAVALDPQAAFTRYNLGLAFYALNRLPEALAAYREALRIEPDNPNTLQNGAVVALRLGDRSTANALTDRLHRLDPARAARLKSGR